MEAARGLAAEDITGVHPHDLLDDLVALRRAVEVAEGEWLRRLSEAEARGAMAATGAASTQGWVRGAAGLSPRKAHQAVLTARALRRDCRATAAALADGDIGVEHAHVITRTVSVLPVALPATAREAEATLVDHARRLDPAQLATVARHLRHVVDPDGLARSEEEQHRARFLSVAATLDGTIAVHGTLEADAGATFLAALQPLSTPVRGPAGERDPRTPGQRRADALVELARRALDRGDLPQQGGERPHLSVVVDLNALQRAASASGPVEQWGAALTGEAARQAACDAMVARILTDGASQVLDVGRTTRVIPVALRKALIARDGGCAFPGCGRPPAWCDAHHIRHWVDGGPTCLSNCVLVCRLHHRTLHRGGWTVALEATGRPVFTPPRWHRPHIRGSPRSPAA